MEIPVLDSGISRLQNPNLLLQLRAVWTWIALVVAAVATFSSLIRRLGRVIVGLRRGRSVISHPSSCSYSSDDDSCSSSDEDDEEDEDEISTASEKDFGDFEEVQGQDGNFDEYFTWPTGLAGGGSVVKFWDGHGRSRWDRIPAVHVASPGMMLSAGEGGLMVWDPRTAESECDTCQANGIGRVVRILGGGGDSCKKVYVGDDLGKLTVVDLRNVRLPLAETLWLGDGAVTGSRGDGLVSWCRRNAAKYLTQ